MEANLVRVPLGPTRIYSYDLRVVLIHVHVLSLKFGMGDEDGERAIEPIAKSLATLALLPPFRLPPIV